MKSRDQYGKYDHARAPLLAPPVVPSAQPQYAAYTYRCAGGCNRNYAPQQLRKIGSARVCFTCAPLKTKPSSTAAGLDESTA